MLGELRMAVPLVPGTGEALRRWFSKRHHAAVSGGGGVLESARVPRGREGTEEVPTGSRRMEALVPGEDLNLKEREVFSRLASERRPGVHGLGMVMAGPGMEAGWAGDEPEMARRSEPELAEPPEGSADWVMVRADHAGSLEGLGAEASQPEGDGPEVELVMVPAALVWVRVVPLLLLKLSEKTGVVTALLSISRAASAWRRPLPSHAALATWMARVFSPGWRKEEAGPRLKFWKPAGEAGRGEKAGWSA